IRSRKGTLLLAPPHCRPPTTSWPAPCARAVTGRITTEALRQAAAAAPQKRGFRSRAYQFNPASRTLGLARNDLTIERIELVVQRSEKVLGRRAQTCAPAGHGTLIERGTNRVFKPVRLLPLVNAGMGLRPQPRDAKAGLLYSAA